MAPSAKVTGISPNEGPPRTKLTIRGENFGDSARDIVSVKICDIECIIFTDWISSKKIITRSPDTVGKGDVIITTIQGGVGVSMIQFDAKEQPIGLTIESGVWVDEKELLDARNPASPSANKQNHSSTNPEFPTSKDFLSENFNSSLFLCNHHGKDSFEELKNFYYNERNKSNVDSQNTVDENDFLKKNVQSIIDCSNALNQFYLMYKKDRQEIGADLTTKVDEFIKSASGEAHDIFDEIISRKDKSDATRNALNVLQRYRFLFNLPSNIQKSIIKKDYDVVINDYSRAKNLFGNSSVNVFQKVCNEVEKRIETFRATLKEEFQKNCDHIDEQNCNIDDLKKQIKYMTAMDIGNDPPWETIQLIKKTLFDRINTCKKTYLAAKERMEHSQSANTNGKLDVANNNEISSGSGEQPEVKFFEEISKSFSTIFIYLFKLAYAYFNGELYNRDSAETLRYKAELFENEVVNHSIDLLCQEFRTVILPSNNYAVQQNRAELSESAIYSLPVCLRCSANCYSNLATLDFGSIHVQNVSVLKPLQSFIYDLRLHTITCLFNHASVQIREFNKKENWNIQLDDIYGVRTNLPLLFESKVIQTLQWVRETVLQIRTADEVDFFSQINVKGQMKQLAQNLIHAFLNALEKSVTNKIPPMSNITPDNLSLIVHCNCFYSANYVLPKLYEAFDKYGYPNMSQVVESAQKKFKELENKLLDMFIEKKRDDIIGEIEPSMYIFDANCTSSKVMPRQVSYYIKDTILKLIFVQAEIYQIAPPLVNRSMFTILIETLNEIERIYSCMANISDAARLQMLVDINAMDYVLHKTGNKNYAKLKRKIDSCRQICNASTQDASIRKIIDQITVEFCHSMRLQISCFNFEYD